MQLSSALILPIYTCNIAGALRYNVPYGLILKTLAESRQDLFHPAIRTDTRSVDPSRLLAG